MELSIIIDKKFSLVLGMQNFTKVLYAHCKTLYTMNFEVL